MSRLKLYCPSDAWTGSNEPVLLSFADEAGRAKTIPFNDSVRSRRAMPEMFGSPATISIESGRVRRATIPFPGVRSLPDHVEWPT